MYVNDGTKKLSKISNSRKKKWRIILQNDSDKLFVILYKYWSFLNIKTSSALVCYLIAVAIFWAVFDNSFIISCFGEFLQFVLISRSIEVVGLYNENSINKNWVQCNTNSSEISHWSFKCLNQHSQTYTWNLPSW